MNSKAIRKQLLAAVAMVLVAAVALGSSTYAWFAGNNTVKAEGMKVQAKAESGILIQSKEKGGDFATIASAGMDNAAVLYPTSTTNLTSWVHAISTKANEAQAEQTAANAYTTLGNTEDTLKNYRALRSFYIRSASEGQPLAGVQLAIKKVEVTGKSGSVLLDEAVRVGVKVSDASLNNTESLKQLFVYAPLRSSDFTLKAKYAMVDGNPTQLVEKMKPVDAGDVLPLLNNTIPASNTELEVEVYIWFEGEDPNCMSKNITDTLDNLNVTITFESQTVA